VVESSVFYSPPPLPDATIKSQFCANATSDGMVIWIMFLAKLPSYYDVLLFFIAGDVGYIKMTSIANFLSKCTLITCLIGTPRSWY
jgi:hypothetical protein